MTNIEVLKEQEILETPILLFDCLLPSGAAEHWCSHGVSVSGITYEARILQHNLFDLKASSEDGFDGVSRVTVSLSNLDSRLSQLSRDDGFKGSKLTVRFLFYDLKAGVPATADEVIFLGVGNPPDEITESAIRLTFTSRLSLQRVLTPDVRIQRRCPWLFPSTLVQRITAVDGATESKYDPFYKCGYSPDAAGGCGNLNGSVPFDACDYSREQCQERGMFDRDTAGNMTARFGGIEFVPSDILVRSYGERSSHVAQALGNEARYNDFVPLVYGTTWYVPPVVFARNDGNLTRMEVLLGMGEIQSVVKVLVNDIEIPEGKVGTNMTGTGWFNLVSSGGRSGGFNLDFVDSSGVPLGDPYGNMAYLSVVVPNQISDGKKLPRVTVMIRGLKLGQFDASGASLGETFSNNPSWVLLDIFRRSGWKLSDIDVASFADTASFCSELIASTDLHGNPVSVPRYQCNLAITKRRTAADLVRGVRTGSGLYVTLGRTGKLQVRPETTIELQQPTKRVTSNSTTPLSDGWPAYEFGDGSNGFSGILRRGTGEPAIRFWSRSTADTVNRLSVEFQDEFNEYQQDSLSLVDVDDALRIGQEIASSLAALGVPNFSQATRVMRTQLDKTIKGNLFVEFESSVRALGLLPGDIITLTYLKEGFDRQAFRIIRIAPGANYKTVKITAQLHDDGWFETDERIGRPGRRQRNHEIGVPGPLLGLVARENGEMDFQIAEESTEDSDSSMTLRFAVEFMAPSKPDSSLKGVPILGLVTSVDTTGGTLAGNDVYYYAVSALDDQQRESGLSFVARAFVPNGTSTNRVSLTGLSFPTGATGFHVYRGRSPRELARVASSLPLAGTFVDDGFADLAIRPPDASFDHANFYWRMELVPEYPANIFSVSTIGNGNLQMLPNEHRGMVVRVTAGKGEGQEAVVSSNSADTFSLAAPWVVPPDASSRFVVAESGWRFGAQTSSSPVRFEVPNRAGMTVHVLGRSANIFDEECPAEISPLTRWQVQGAEGSAVDADVPDAPIFGFSTDGRGSIELAGVGFSRLINTRTVTAGTCTIGYWNELNGTTAYHTGTDIDELVDVLTLAEDPPGTIGQWIQIEREVMVIAELLPGRQYRVTRGSHGSPIGAHAFGTPVFHLDRKVFILPFVKDFFGSPASGSYSFPFHIPDSRVAVAELFMTNFRGNSDVARYSFTTAIDGGLRTLSGGQFAIQVEGFLAVQTDAAPVLVIDTTHSVRDIFATVQEPADSGTISLLVKIDGQPYANLNIAAGSTVSNVVQGFDLPPLLAKSQLGLDVTRVGDAGNNPGRDLTVTVRL